MRRYTSRTTQLTALLMRVLLFLGILLVNLTQVIRINSDESNNSLSVEAKSTPSIAKTARQITVRLLGKSIAGSGVIISRKGNIYTVLTCAHVVQQPLGFDGDKSFFALTSDGRSHQAKIDYSAKFHQLDLAIVHFTSFVKYRIVDISQDEKLELNYPSYISGFPTYLENSEQDSFVQGIKAYRLTIGKVGILLPKPIIQGYQIGLTNDVNVGMSGGPVLNRKGQLVGVIGRMQDAASDPSAYEFADGTQPTEEMLSEMKSVSWAIPVESFVQSLVVYLSP